jgi:hypothetical protein
MPRLLRSNAWSTMCRQTCTSSLRPAEQGYRETALEACLLAKEKLQAIREELHTPTRKLSSRHQSFLE